MNKGEGRSLISLSFSLCVQGIPLWVDGTRFLFHQNWITTHVRMYLYTHVTNILFLLKAEHDSVAEKKASACGTLI